MDQFAYHILEPGNLASIKLPLKIALEEFTGETISDDLIYIEEQALNFSYVAVANEAEPLIELSDAITLAQLLLQQINISFNAQYEAGASPVPNLFPLHTRIQSTLHRGNNEGFEITIGFELEVYQDEYLPVTGLEVKVFVGEDGRILALFSNWSPVVSRYRFVENFGSLNDAITYFESEEHAVAPNIFFEDRSLNMLLPGVLYVGEDSSGYYPTVNTTNMTSTEETVEVGFNYENEDLIRSTDEMDQTILGYLFAFGVQYAELNANVIRLNAINDCFEAMMAANGLHQTDASFTINRWHRLEDFSFKLTERMNADKAKGTMHIKLDDYELILESTMMGNGYKICMEFKDNIYPDNNLKYCHSVDQSSGLYEQSTFDPYETDRQLVDNYLWNTDDFLILQPNGNGSMNIYGVEVTPDMDKAARMEEIENEIGSHQCLVVDAQDFAAYVDDSGTPYVDAETTLRTGIASSSVHALDEYTRLAEEGHYGKRNTSKLVGESGELSLRARRKWLDLDLNEVPWRDRRGNIRYDNHPIWDIEGTMYGQEGLIQIKTSRAQNASSRFKTYDGGLLDIMGGLKNNRRRTLFESIATQDFAGSGLTQVEILAEAKRQGILAVNDSDVGAYREHVEAKIKRDPGKYASYFDALLETDGMEVNGHRINSMADVDALNDAVIRERVLNELIDRVQSKIIGNGVDTAGNQRLAEYHGDLKQSGLARTDIDTAHMIAPEAGMIQQMGRHKAGMQAGLRTMGPSAMFGAGFAIVGELTGEGEFDYGRVVVTGAASGVGEAAGTYASTATSLYPQLITRYGTKGAIAGKGIGGGVVGAISAPVVELSVMMYDDHVSDTVDYEGYEYSSRVGSEAVGGVFVGAASGLATAGATSIILSTALAGTVAGTTVPVVGNVAGFVVGVVVGIAAYAAYSYFAKDAVQEGIATVHLSATDELSTLMGNYEVHDYGFFQVVASRLPGGQDYAVYKTRERITIMNPNDGGYSELVKVKPVGAAARELFGQKPFDFVDIRIVHEL